MTISLDGFAKEFTFGVATSAYQIEGHGFGGAGRTHWDDFAQTPGNVVRFENGAVACDHYHRFEEDLDLVAQGGFDAYRFSISWARVLPEGRGAANPEGLDFYDRLVDAMLERGLKPCATLYHWELPSPLSDLGGWRNREIADWLADYTDLIMRRLGDRMHSVAPINEPWCVSWLSHFEGAHAPGMRDIRAAARAMHHVNLAHGRSIEVMRALGMKNLGAIFNLEWADPADDSPEAKAAAARQDAINNRFFMDGVFRKEYPEILLEGLEEFLPKGWQDDFDTIGTPIDWCGINYYTRRNLVASDAPWPALGSKEGSLPKTQMGWEIYPQGLYELLMRATREYSRDIPIYITENGMANADQVVGGRVDDAERIAFLNAHLAEIERAIADGAPVQGYFVWSLLDNYEWALGYEKRFGLVHVDFETQKRTPKASYHALKAALTTR